MFPPIMKQLPALFTLLLLVSPPAAAQAPTPPKAEQKDDEHITDKENPKHPFWEASLPGGHFQVAISKIVSVSIHEYVLDGAVVVTEMTVDTDGQALPRFYFMEPVSDRTSGTGTGSAISAIVDRGRELVEKASQRTGSDLQDMVHKKYGISTHTKTLEYRVYDTAELSALYSSVRRSWETGRGRKITIR
jgi:hypothetical protein